MSKIPDILLSQMLEYIADIEKYTADVVYEDFYDGTMVYDATLLKLALIGENGVQLQNILKDTIADFPFAEMRGLRNIIIHNYLGIDDILIWTTIHTSIPILKEKIHILQNTLLHTNSTYIG